MKKGDIVIAIRNSLSYTKDKEYEIITTSDSEKIIAIICDSGFAGWVRAASFKLKPRLVCVHKRVSRRA